jgi:hypothetical protein
MGKEFIKSFLCAYAEEHDVAKLKDSHTFFMACASMVTIEGFPSEKPASSKFFSVLLLQH